MVPPYNGKNKDIFLRQLEIYRDAGLNTDVVFDAVRGIPDYSYLKSEDRKKPLAEQDIPSYWLEQTADYYEDVKKVLGDDVTVYCFGWDEPSMYILRNQRAAWKSLQENGLKTYTTGHDKHLLNAGFNEDFINYGGRYSAETARLWHSFGVRITSYAGPHTGPENPDFVRRSHGMDLYLADQDGTNNYMVSGDQWNDFGSQHNYRSFNMIYPASDGPVNTLEFEAFREAIDDVKYATLLKELAAEAIESGNVDNIYAGKAALQWLIQVDPKTCDLNALRLEMIDKILELRE